MTVLKLWQCWISVASLKLNVYPVCDSRNCWSGPELAEKTCRKNWQRDQMQQTDRWWKEPGSLWRTQTVPSGTLSMRKVTQCLLDCTFCLTFSGLWDLLICSVCFSAPQLSSKPSPSKRRCSEENLQPAADEENQEPVKTQTVVPVLSDPSTDRTPPVGPASIQQSLPLKKTSPQPDVQLTTVKSEPDKMAVTSGPDGPSSREAPADSTLQTNKEDPGDHLAPAAAGMKSRFQKLAEERKCWDSEGKHVVSLFSTWCFSLAECKATHMGSFSLMFSML